MKRGLNSVLLIISALTVVVIFGCPEANPQTELTAHMERIVSILKEYQDDANKASSSLKDYINNNLASIKNIIAKIEEKSVAAEDKGKPDIKLIFRHTRIIKDLEALEQEKPLLMNDEKVKEALRPLFEVLKISI
jgi:uncharacterized membrane protein